MINTIEEGYTYDDLMLVPQCNQQGSRFSEHINIGTQITPSISLATPIISANMDTITEYQMANLMSKLGALGIVHRFMEKEKQAQQLAFCTGTRVACIGVNLASRHRLDLIMDQPAGAHAVLIDIAHGHCLEMIEQIRWCRQTYPQLDIIAGNIATMEAATDLLEAGADCLKVGVGPGSLCTTRINTGNGIPQMTAINNVAEAVDQSSEFIGIIADGGIRHSGDMIKALAIGANAVMIGGLLAGTTETPGETFTELDGTKYKIYRGMASRDAQHSWKGNVTSVEGESKRVKEKGSAGYVIEDLVNNLRSGMTYQNASSLSRLQQHARFIKQTTAGALEARAHGLL